MTLTAQVDSRVDTDTHHNHWIKWTETGSPLLRRAKAGHVNTGRERMAIEIIS